jgi:hypothetical protein
MGREVDINKSKGGGYRYLSDALSLNILLSVYWLELVKVTGGLAGHRKSLGYFVIQDETLLVMFNGPSGDVVSDGVA